MMGYPFFSAEHVVLALLAGQALRACGLDHDSVASKVLESWTGGLPPCPPQAGVTSAGPNSHSRELLGQAEGLAGGTGDVGSHHGLIAFLWGDEGRSAFQFEQWGTTGPEVVEALDILGVRLPTVPRPEPGRTPWGGPVFVPLERYGDVVRALGERLDAGTWGCNSYDDRAWLDAHAHIDVQAIVVRVPGRQGFPYGRPSAGLDRPRLPGPELRGPLRRARRRGLNRFLVTGKGLIEPPLEEALLDTKRSFRNDRQGSRRIGL